MSKKKGGKKSPVSTTVINERGIEGDGHSGDWHRQISLLSMENILEVNSKGVEAKPGDFAENLTVSGIDLGNLEIGDRLEITGKEKNEAYENRDDMKNSGVILEVTQIGKECPKPCRIYYQMGSCIMPKEGIFCRIIKPGRIAVGNMITFLK